MAEKKDEKKAKRGPLVRRDVMEITSGFSQKNAEIKNRVDDATGEKIPDGMPLWRWRRRHRP